MRILYLVHRFPPDHFRGTEIYTWELAREMQSRGHRVLVVTLRELREDGSRFSLVRDSYGGVEVGRIVKKIQPENFETYFFDPELDRIFGEILEDFQPDLVHSTYFLGGLSLGMSLKALERGKFFITITDYSGICARGQLLDRDLKFCPGPRQGVRCLYCLFDQNWLFQNPGLDHWAREYLPIRLGLWKRSPELTLIRKRNQMIKEIMDSASAVIFASEFTHAVFRAQKFKLPRVHFLDYGVDFSPFQSHQKTPSAQMRIGFIGQILPHKGLHLLVEALAGLVNQEDFELKIYGSLSEPEEKSYFESLNLSRIKNQRYFGTFDFSQMNRILEGIDLLVVPSLWQENCPLVPKYALLTGTRLLCSEAPGIFDQRTRLALKKKRGTSVDFFRRGAVLELRAKIERLLKSGLWREPSESLSGLVMRIQDHTEILERIYLGN